MISLFRHRNYLLFLSARSIDSAGTGLGLTALIVLVTAVGEPVRDSGNLGFLFFVEPLITLFALLPAGAWIDRLSHRSVLVNAALVRAALLLTIPIVWWAGALSAPHLYVVAAGTAIASAFTFVAQTSYLPRVVDAGRLHPANAALSTAGSVEAFVMDDVLQSPAKALIRSLPGAGFLVQVVTSLAAALLFRRIDVPEETPSRGARRPLLRELGEGVRFLLGRRDLRGLFAAAGLVHISLFALPIIYLVMIREAEHSLAAYRWREGGESLGFLTGALIAWPLARRLGGTRVIWLSLLVTQPFLMLVPLVPDGWPAALHAVPAAVHGAGLSIAGIAQITYLQRTVPDHLRGRTLAAWHSVLSLIGLLGNVGWLALSRSLNPAVTIACVVAILMLAALISLRTVRETELISPARL
ncbi:MFS transporter [Streptosporangium roseum]|uniref:MFS transporter n=1 Tax=Streptosporangium roseum TaxID=2001 RepID=UPI00333455C7